MLKKSKWPITRIADLDQKMEKRRCFRKQISTKTNFEEVFKREMKENDNNLLKLNETTFETLKTSMQLEGRPNERESPRDKLNDISKAFHEF